MISSSTAAETCTIDISFLFGELHKIFLYTFGVCYIKYYWRIKYQYITTLPLILVITEQHNKFSGIEERETSSSRRRGR